MKYVSLQATITLTEWSERTIRRRIADGTLPYTDSLTVGGGQNKTMIDFEAIKNAICISLEDDDLELIEAADAGDASAQNDLAMLFLEHDKPKSAIYWLELSVKQNFADAMQHLGNCYLKGYGVSKDHNLAIMWIAKAASLGHAIADQQIKSLLSLGKFSETLAPLVD